MNPGGSLTIALTVASENGFSSGVSISFSGAPSGTVFSPAMPFTMNPGSQNITLAFPSNTTVGSYTLLVQGTSGVLQHDTTVTFSVQTPQPYAGFSVVINDSLLTVTQGASASTSAGLSITSGGNMNFDVRFSISGLPSGVQATFGTNPLAIGQAATALTITASANAALANYAVVTVTGTRTADGLQEHTTFQINVTPPVTAIPFVRTDFVRIDGTPAAAVYDSLHDVVYVSNPQWNRIDVISPSTHKVVNSIPAPSPTGMDLSLDGKHLIVTSNMQQIVSIDTASLQVVQRTNVPPIVQGGASYAIPDLIANTSSGLVLVGMTNNSDPPSYYLEQWNPATGAFTALAAPGVSAWINQLVRTGDGRYALVVDYGTDVNLAVYDAASGTFSAQGQSPVGQVLGVAGDPAADVFAIVGVGGAVLVDNNLNTLGTLPIGGVFWGIQFSPDGSSLYATVATTINSCPLYPLILTVNTSSHALVGEAPAFETGPLPRCDPYLQATPMTADGTGMLYSSFSHGVVLDDPANTQSLLSLPLGPKFPSLGFDDEAPLNASLATSLGNIAYDVLPGVWFGNIPGTNIQFDAGLVSVTAPPSPATGLVNVTAVEPDGWFSLDPQAFSYGSGILFSGANQASSQGGATLALIGYGLVGNTGVVPTVTIGGQAATVTGSAKYWAFVESTLNDAYPFRDMDEVTVTVPPGTATTADIAIASQAGTATLPKAFSYLSVSDFASSDTFTFALYDPKRHWVYLSAGSHIDVFNADTSQFLSPIVPPSVSGNRTILGLALTPDNSTLLAANLADSSVAIINPDNPAASSVVSIPPTAPNLTGVADVVATGNGNVFVDNVSATSAGCGGSLSEFNLATLKVTQRTDLPFPELQVGGSSFSRSADGSDVLIGAPNCGAYLWNAATDTFAQSRLVSDTVSASADGYWFSSDFVRLDAQMIQHMQAQIPEFFSASLSFPDLRGEKMNASGSLLYTPVPGGSGRVQSNGVYITDTNTGNVAGSILLTEQIASVQNAMDYDEAGNRLFLITDKGLTVVQLSGTPLSIGYLNPSLGPAAGGTTVNIRGSGFESGATVTIGGAPAEVKFVDSSTLAVTVPAGSAGGARVLITNPGGASYRLDAGFTYQ